MQLKRYDRDHILVKHVLLLLILSLLSCIGLTIGSLLYVQRIVMQDSDTVMYGFPLPWIKRILSTFAGPTDILYP